MKRFTDTTKWTDPWFRRLSAPAKMLWFYILDHCDHIGIIEVDLELASLDCGIAITDASLKELGARIESIGQGKFMIPKFIGFQIGQPSTGCPAHKKTISAINDHGLIQDSLGYHYPSNSHTEISKKTINSLKDKEEDKDKEEEEEEKKKRASKARPENRGEFDAYFRQVELLPRDAEYAWNHWNEKGWKNGRDAIKDWKMTVVKWKAAGHWPTQKGRLANEQQWTGASATKPHWLPENWSEIAVSMFGPAAKGFKSHTEVPRTEQHAFYQVCIGERELYDTADASHDSLFALKSEMNVRTAETV